MWPPRDGGWPNCGGAGWPPGCAAPAARGPALSSSAVHWLRNTGAVWTGRLNGSERAPQGAHSSEIDHLFRRKSITCRSEATRAFVMMSYGAAFPSLLCRNGSLRSYSRPPGREVEENVPSAARAFSGPVTPVGSEPDVGVGHARPGYPRETERPGWAGRCDRRRTGEGVPSSDHPSAAEGSFGARADGGNGRCRLLRQTSLEAVLSRAGTTSGWALTLPARESSAPQRRDKRRAGG